jgi:protein tyrosine phosphatase (PTP) superfamily phosphohydrolase (DUF442 family)
LLKSDWQTEFRRATRCAPRFKGSRRHGSPTSHPNLFRRRTDFRRGSGRHQAAGFQSIVCHRPDGEAADQPSFASIKQAAEAMGIEARHIPVGPMGVTADAVRAMVDAIEEMPQPMLGYCRSGARSTAIFQHTAHLRN